MKKLTHDMNALEMITTIMENVEEAEIEKRSYNLIWHDLCDLKYEIIDVLGDRDQLKDRLDRLCNRSR